MVEPVLVEDLSAVTEFLTERATVLLEQAASNRIDTETETEADAEAEVEADSEAEAEAEAEVETETETETEAEVEAEAETEAESEASSSGCPTESLRRIGLCQKIVRNAITPDPNPGKPQVVPLAAKFSSSKVCSDVRRAFSSIPARDCTTMATHIDAVGGGLNGLVAASRQRDIHDVCVTLLSTASKTGQRYINSADAPSCSLKSTGGLAGVRALFLHGMGIDRLTYRGSSGTAYSQAYDGWLGMFPKYWKAENNLDGIADARYYVSKGTRLSIGQ